MRVLVTGGTGFTGSHTVRALLEAGHRVRLLVRDRAKLERVFGPGSAAAEDHVVGDVTRREDVQRAMEGCDAVAHMAAVVDLRASNAAYVLHTNRAGVENVIDGAVAAGIESILYVSSLGAFFRPGAPPLTPDEPILTKGSAYARSKAEGERHVRAFQDRGVPIRISYPAGVVGPDDPGMSETNEAVLAWTGTMGIDTSSGIQLLDVRDLARLHVKLLALPPRPCRYVAAGELIPWSRFADLLESVTGVRPRVVPIPGPALRGLGLLGDWVKRVWDFPYPITYESMSMATQWPGADASRTVRELGITFRPAAESLRDTLRWMYEAGHLSAQQVGRLATSAP